MRGAGFPLGVVAAMSLEGSILAGRPVMPGELVCFGQGAFLAVSGTGPERAGLAALRLIKKGAAALASWGMAAGLKPGIAAGHVIIPDEVIAPKKLSIQPDPAWKARLCSRLQGRVVFFGGALAGTASVLGSPEDKRGLFAATGAIAADMESAAIGRAALSAGVPFIAIRAVTDTFDMAVPPCAAGAADSWGNVLVGRLVCGLLMKPGDLKEMIPLGKNFLQARRSLRSVAAHGGHLFCLEGNGGAPAG